MNLHLVRWRTLLACAVAMLSLVVAVSQAAAFANNYLATYDLYHTIDSTYGPYTGKIYGSNIVSGAQYIQAENWNMKWTVDAAGNLHLYVDHLGPVFHVFKSSTVNCAADFNFDGYWETNMRDAWLIQKNATCSGGNTSVKNEARVY